MTSTIQTSLRSFGVLVLGALAPAAAVFAQCTDIAITPVTLPDAQQGASYAVPFSATGAGGEPIWQSAGLPPGLSLTGNGFLGGTPTAAGTYPVRIMVSTIGGCVAGQLLSLTVAPPASTAPVPTITILRTTTDEPTSQPLAGTMSITDPDDAGAATFSAVIGVDAGTLSVAAGSAAVTVAGNATAAVTLTGTLADINAVLAGSGDAAVSYAGDGTPFAQVTLSLTANDGTDSVTATGIISGPTVYGPRVAVISPNQTRQLAVGALDAEGDAVPGATLAFVSSVPATVAVDGSGQVTTNTVRSASRIDVTGSGLRPAATWVAVNSILPVNVGSSVPASIASADGFSAFGSNTGLPTTSYYADIYALTLTANQAVTIEADSGDDLDTYLFVANADGFVVADNDDDDTGTLGVGSRIDFIAPAAGTYLIEASTFNGLDTGNYTLRVSATPPRPGAAPARPVREVLRVKR